MGATQWRYVVPYEADIESALTRLRDDVFGRTDYSRGGLNALAAKLERLNPEAAASYRERYKHLLKPQRPKSIAALIKKCGESGTHDILDIDHVCEVPEHSGLSRVTDDDVMSIFGTLHPTRDQISKDDGTVRFYEKGLYERGCAVYIVLYRDGIPAEYYIEGCTGD